MLADNFAEAKIDFLMRFSEIFDKTFQFLNDNVLSYKV